MSNNISSIYNHLSKTVAITATIFTVMAISPVSWAQTAREVERLTVQQTTKSLEIENITHDGVDRALNPGEILTITMEGTPKVQASFLLIGDKQTIKEISAQEIAPGTYQSKILVSEKERTVEGAVMGRLQQGKQVIYSAASEAFTYSRDIARTYNWAESPPSPTGDSETSLPSQLSLTTDKNLRPQFTSHSNRDAINNNGFIIQGQTQPHADVTITVTSQFSLIGELIQLEGNTLINQTVQANSLGIFQLAIPPTNNAPSGLKYLINAVAMLNSQTSEPTKLTLIQP